MAAAGVRAEENTITGNLDITGDVVTFGTLDEVTPATGVTLQFSDVSSVAAFNSALGRPQALWQWDRAISAGSGTTMPVMKLQSTGGLSLVDPAAPTGSPTVKIDPRPDQISILPKLELSGQTASTAASVITRALGDARYLTITSSGDAEVQGTLTVGGYAVLTEQDGAGYALQTALASLSSNVTSLQSSVSSGYVAKSSDTLAIGTNATAAGGGFSIGYQAIAGANAISIGGYSGNNGYAASGEGSVALGFASHGVGTRGIALGMYNWAGGTDSIVMGYQSVTNMVNGVAIGRSTWADRPGQIVLGAYNAYSGDNSTPQPADNLFVIGNGTADDARSNAFIIKRNGDTEVKGGLRVEGQRDPSAPNPTTTNKVIPKSGQVVLVPEQGDISMGDFRAGALPVSP